MCWRVVPTRAHRPPAVLHRRANLKLSDSNAPVMMTRWPAAVRVAAESVGNESPAARPHGSGAGAVLPSESDKNSLASGSVTVMDFIDIYGFFADMKKPSDKTSLALARALIFVTKTSSSFHPGLSSPFPYSVPWTPLVPSLSLSVPVSPSLPGRLGNVTAATADLDHRLSREQSCDIGQWRGDAETGGRRETGGGGWLSG